MRLPFHCYALLILLSWVFLSLCQDFSCSPSKPCALGCCGKNNVCGLGPSYCAPANCTSSCDQKSDCDPGWGPQWSSSEKCPLNVCCSKFGERTACFKRVNVELIRQFRILRYYLRILRHADRYRAFMFWRFVKSEDYWIL